MYKNLACLGICSLCLLACIQYHLQNASTWFRILPKLMGAYFVIDLPFTRQRDFQIHHATSIGILLYTYYYGVDPMQFETIWYHLLKTELSTFFLIFRYYLPKNTRIYVINNYVFYAVFTKVRIIDLYQNMIGSNSQIYTVVQTYTPHNSLATGLFLSCCYTLYGLNVYWFTIMNRKLVEDIYNNKQ